MSQRGTVDEDLHDGLGMDGVLAVGAGLGAAGWGATAVLARQPGLALEVAGVDAVRGTVWLWALLSLLTVAVGIGIAARAVRLSPLLWLWALLVAGGLAIDVAALRGHVPFEYLRYALYHQWFVVFAVGYGATAAVAGGRCRRGYALGSLAAATLGLVAFLFPETIDPYAFLLLGALHVGPILADVWTSRAIDDAAAEVGA